MPRTQGRASVHVPKLWQRPFPAEHNRVAAIVGQGGKEEGGGLRPKGASGPASRSGGQRSGPARLDFREGRRRPERWDAGPERSSGRGYTDACRRRPDRRTALADAIAGIQRWERRASYTRRGANREFS